MASLLKCIRGFFGRHESPAPVEIPLRDMTNIPIPEYDNLPEPLKRQLIAVQPSCKGDRDILAAASKLYKKYKAKANTEAAESVFRLAILKILAPDYLFAEKWYPYVYCYDSRGHIVRLESILRSDRHIYIIRGRLDDKFPVVIKWYEYPQINTSHEINIYRRLRSAKCKVIWFSGSYSFWNSPILVHEVLQDITKDDNLYEIGCEILGQLRYLHDFGVHNAIKPANIMKRVMNGKPSYFLVNYAHVATGRLGWGYRRHAWTPIWTSQRPHARDQITTAKNDFIELGYTLKTIENWRTGSTNIRSGFGGKIQEYMNRTSQVDEMNILQKDYDDLIEILRSN